MRKIYVISDTHFNHANILNFTQENGKPVRNFSCIEEMNECIIDNWNTVVKDGDIVYHLGDVFFHGTEPTKIELLLSRLNGRKRLILGNHDNAKAPVLQKFFQKITMWRMFPEYGVLLTHVPVHPGTLGENRFRENKMLNVHGHLHTNTVKGSSNQLYRNVCVEKTDYTPVDIESIT